jgi:hypothetical protein
VSERDARAAQPGFFGLLLAMYRALNPAPICVRLLRSHVHDDHTPSFFARLGLAFRVLGNPDLAAKLSALEAPAPVTKPVETPPEKTHAAGLGVLALLQREGRLVDFLQEDVASFSDAEIGAAARVVHAGSRKVLAQYLTLEPVLNDSEGAAVSVPAGFNAERIRLTGNVAGQPPFRGTLKHHGWVASSVRFPAMSTTLDPRVIAPAEVEL